MTREELNAYVERTRATWPQAFFLPRGFETAADWNRFSSLDFRLRPSFGGREIRLENVLQHRRAAILGEAGSGKSTIARHTINVAAERGWIPVFVPLKSYRGNLAELVGQQAPADVLNDPQIEGTPTEILYILDGFDEVPAAHLDAFINELDGFAADGSNARALLTSRQAFFVAQTDRLNQPFEVFYILDLSEDDITAILQRYGLDNAAFRRAAANAHISQELGNPLALESLATLYRDTHSLGSTRSEPIRHVVDSVLATRPTFDPRRQKRALRMLGVAMEVYARNELTETDARSVLRQALRIPADAANRLLEELTQSILVRTQNGYAFQMRSYGEYLAAEELAEIRETERILRLTYFGGTFRPSESWRNCISYLVELHLGVRSWFSRRRPDWLLTSSPSVFTDEERTTIIRELLASLCHEQAYLLQHPTIRAANVARFVPAQVLASLRAAMESPDDVEAANAVLLLGACGDHTVADRVLAIAFDAGLTYHMRHSALAALEVIGRPEFVPQLLDIQDWSDPMAASRIDCAAALTDRTSMAQLLDALGRTDVTISSAFYRFRELIEPADIEAVLDALATVAPDMLSSRLLRYLDAFWRAVAANWTPGWEAKVAAVLLRLEEAADADDRDLERELLPAMRLLPDQGSAIAREVFAELLRRNQDVHHLYHTLPGLVGRRDAEWLAQQPGSERLIRSVRAFGTAEARDALQLPISADQQREIDKWREADKKKEARTQRLQTTILSSENADELHKALVQLDGRWPGIGQARKEWLARHVGDTLTNLDLRHRIRWTSDTQLTHPGILPLLLKVVSKYELRLADDRPLVWALQSESEATRTYQKRYGLTPAGVASLEELLDDPGTATGAMDSVLSFVYSSKISTPALLGSLERIALDGGRPRRIRERAIDALAQAGAGAALVRMAPSLPPELLSQVDDRLIDAQYRPTIERRLQHLIDNPADLNGGEVEHHVTNPLQWIGRIRMPEAWDKLRRLRVLALQRQLPNVVGLLTGTLKEIDMMGAVHVIQQQLDLAPVNWQPYERTRAIELERDATIRAAQAAPFDEVVRRLDDATSLNRFKIWTEGPTDRPSVETLAHKIPGLRSENVVAQQFGGWANILSPHWTPQGLDDGCHDFIMLFDGDRAYDYSKAGLALRAEVRGVLATLKTAGINYHVLERYGLENYFPQHAFEELLGRSLAGVFPLDPRRPVTAQLPGYGKNMNADLAARTTMADIAGTDLAVFFETVRRLSGG